MNFYPHHIGDYLTATAHLTWLEDCAYRRLLDVYYSREQAIPADVVQACRLVRALSKDERKAVHTVLNEFFTAGDSGWVHTRCEAEIVKAKAAAARAAENGKKGGRPPKDKPNDNPEKTQPVIFGNPDESKSKATNPITNPITNPNGSEANASGGKPPADPTPKSPKPVKPLTPAEQEKASLWAWLKARLVEQKTSHDVKAAGVLAGGLATKYGNDVFAEAARVAMAAEPGHVHTYIVSLCETAAGKRVPLGRLGQMTDEQREAANAAATEEAMRRLRAGRAGGDVIDAEATEILDAAYTLEDTRGH